MPDSSVGRGWHLVLMLTGMVCATHQRVYDADLLE